MSRSCRPDEVTGGSVLVQVRFTPGDKQAAGNAVVVRSQREADHAYGLPVPLEVLPQSGVHGGGKIGHLGIAEVLAGDVIFAPEVDVAAKVWHGALSTAYQLTEITTNIRQTINTNIISTKERGR